MRGPIVLATYNVHGCVGTDGRRDADRVAAVLTEIDADVVALQEVFLDERVPGEGMGEPPVELHGYRLVLGQTFPRHPGHVGNAVLSRHPVARAEEFVLSVPGREPRGALDATIALPRGDLRVLATHLGLGREERKAQVEVLARRLDEAPEPFLAVLGDFNDGWPGAPSLRPLERRLGRSRRIRTFPSRAPLLALDRIWVHPRKAVLEVRSHRSARARRASDHLPLVALVSVPASG